MDSSKPNVLIAPQSPLAGAPLDNDEIDLRELWDTLLEGRWLALGVASAVLLAGAAYAWLATPIYRADAIVQVEERKAAIPGLDELSAALGGGNAKSLAEIEIIRSRTVVGRVVSDLGLDIHARPRRFPLLGPALARRHERGELTSAWPGFRRFAWGGEYVEVGRLAVPARQEGKRLILEAGQNGAYRLYGERGQLLLQGQVGKPAEARAQGGQPLSIYVRELVAAPGTQFVLVKKPFNQVVAELQKELKVSERGKQTGILQVTLEGPKAQLAVDIVNGVVNAYLRQNVERQSEEASHMLAFLDQQLPELKKQLDTAEAALREYKSRTGAAVDISAEGQEMLSRATDIEKQISELELQRSELRQRFTEQHPLFIALNQKLNQVRQQRTALEGQFKNLPETELQSIRLVRNVKVANELYVALLNRAQELKVAKAGTIGNARALDPAVLPIKPVRPRKPLVLALSLLLGAFAGAVAVFLRKSMSRMLDSPDRIESQLGLPVYATIPHSRTQSTLASLLQQKAATKGLRILCRTAPQDPAVESLRSLRTSLQFALLEAGNNIVAIHGPTPEIGKSFIASNLAFLMADIGKRVLLIDADLRKGHMHGVVGVERVPGLADVISGQCTLQDAVHPLEDGRVSFLATGTLPPNPAELLVHGNFVALLSQASKQYDYVVIDTPPTLNLADSISIGKLAGTNFMVVRGGHNTLQDVQIACRRMQQSDIVISGVIFNDLSLTTSRYRYGGYYAYQYGQKR
ncbi:MAG TPA: polysaccharide biosynthesis tyrosine autokinase [Nevskiales bacterium]|nr:polysaccharide biosynthesis tyrosine autokinase [Nevskiales bacterium]